MEEYSRTQLLLGKEAMARLSRARVAVFGVGGVGGYAVEALARSGVGAIDLIDSDCVSRSNLNRQIIATQETIGRKKTEVARERILSVNPACCVETHDVFYLPETAALFSFSAYSYIIDAIDTVAGKISIVERATKEGVPVISAMGAGNKLDPTKLRVADISETRVCPLARVMRRELKKRGILHGKVVYSEEEPCLLAEGEIPELRESGRPVPGSVAFVPSVAGLILAGEVVKDLAWRRV